MAPTDPAPPPAPDGLPELPEAVPAESLRGLDGDGLTAVEQALRSAEQSTLSAMSPFERRLKEVRARIAEIATERRRRERSERHAARIAVREAAGSGAMPGLADALAAPALALPDEHPLRDVPAYLRTGGQVGFGYPNRPGSITFTDGRRTAQATTVGEARRLWGEGWEPGTPGLTGVRVHLAGTRVERLAPLDEVVVDLGTAGA
ncbi:MAG TPA: hypothetical protein VFO60_10665 [Candidatus Dormibacteraeota bacterium]|nr:hypothetical protein [Candidatus Dormibacteraeota bacterium]